MKLNPIENPILACHIVSRMLEISEGTVVNKDASVKIISVDTKTQSVEIERKILGERETIPIQELDCDSFKMACPSREEIRYTPEFWGSQLLTKDEVSDICKWLMILQSAHTMADSVSEGDEPEDSKEMNAFYKMQYYKGLSNCQSLVRHLHALKESVY